MAGVRNCVVFAALLLMAGCNREPSSNSQEAAENRGKYVVENVAMCGDCHTPRGDRGEFDRSRWLQGSDLDFRPLRPDPNWADKAPGIAGLPRLGDAAVIKLLEAGLLPNGKPARPPMPQYRMSHADAGAVADYLKELPAAPK